MHKLHNPHERVGIQASAIGGSFHEIAAIEYGYEVGQLVPFDTHADLIHGMRRNGAETQDPSSVDTVLCAVDNTDSGRVLSAIGALANYKEYHIVGVQDLNVPQVALRHPETPLASVTHILSQKPALDQCYENIKRRGYITLEVSDTLLSAALVKEAGGVYMGNPTIALASEQAGEYHGLVAEGILSDNPDSKTRFWVLSKERDWDKIGNHAAFTLEIPDEEAALLGAIRIISGEGYNLTDIDSHLNPVSRKNRAFFVEVRRDGKNVQALMKKLKRNDYNNRLLGIYNSTGPLLLDGDAHSIPTAVNHDSWQPTQGLDVSVGTSVIYISARNEAGSLQGMLEAMKLTNILDMSRPISGKGGHRGFYFTLDKNTKRATTSNIMRRLENEGYTATDLEYNGEKLDI